MSALEIVLLITGFISVAASFIFFMVADGTDMDGSSDINVGLSDKQKEEIKKQIVDAYSEQMDEMTDSVYEKTELALEKLSNQKIKELNDYSETVLGDINKNHTEVMFLYDMLNEKNKEVHNNIRDISIAADQLNAAKDEAIDSAAKLKDAFSEEKEILENAVNVANAAVANAENAANVANVAVANAESAANAANAAVANAENAANAANAAVANAENAANATNAAVANAENATNAANAAAANAASQASAVLEKKPARTRTAKKANAEDDASNNVNIEGEVEPAKKKTVPRKKTQVIKEAALQVETESVDYERVEPENVVSEIAGQKQEYIITDNNIFTNNIAANNTVTNSTATGNNGVIDYNAAISHITEEKGNNTSRSTESDMEYMRVRSVPELKAGNVNVTKGGSKKAAILELYREGKSNVEIAKTLGLGIGEVRLVIDLYKGQR